MLHNYSILSMITISLLLFLQHVSCSPVMHTYIDDTTPDYKYKTLLGAWLVFFIFDIVFCNMINWPINSIFYLQRINAWQKSGWDITILTPEDARKHNLYPRFRERMDALGLIHFPRHSYMRNLAMEMTPSGGFFTDIFVYPLHRLKSDDLDDDDNAKLPHTGEMTFHDGHGGSAISGSLDAWNRINLYLVDHIEKNAYDSLQKLGDDFIHYERNHLTLNIFSEHDRDTCDKASTKFVIRFHHNDLRILKVRPMKTDVKEALISKWLNLYEYICWEKKIPFSQLGGPFYH